MEPAVLLRPKNAITRLTTMDENRDGPTSRSLRPPKGAGPPRDLNHRIEVLDQRA